MALVSQNDEEKAVIKQFLSELFELEKKYYGKSPELDHHFEDAWLNRLIDTDES